MEHFFAMLGLCSIALVLLYLIKVYYDKKEDDSSFIKNQKVYKAAKAYKQYEKGDRED